MQLERDSKITYVKLKSIDVKEKKKEGAGKINFSINGIMFATDKTYSSEKELYEVLLIGNNVLCKHVFEMDLVDCEEIKSYNVWLEDDHAVIFRIDN